MKFSVMPAPESPAKQSKSDFIRSQPESLSPAEVVEKAKAAGLSLSKNLVYLVRGKADGKGKLKKSTAKKAAKKELFKAAPKKSASKTVTIASTKGTSKKSPSMKKTSKKTPSSTMSKADFVRANPGVSARDVVAKALFEGVEISETHVYGVRSQDKKSASKKKGAAPKKSTVKTVSKKTTSTPKESPKPRASNGTGASGSSVEALLLAAAAELGLGRAIELLQVERARVRGLMGG
jgi:hypothetical protein